MLQACGGQYHARAKGGGGVSFQETSDDKQNGHQGNLWMVIKYHPVW